MSELDEIMEGAYRSVHSCDLCSVSCCESFTEPVGDMRPCSFESVDGLWLCDVCWPMPTEVPNAS